MAREVGDGDRLSVDLHALAIRDEVRLRCLAHTEAGGTQCAPGECQHAALPVRPADERPAQPQMRIAERREERPRPAQAQPDTETATRRERGERFVILGRWGRGGHSRVSSSS